MPKLPNPPAVGYAIGLMSGTSADGIDAALVRFEEQPGQDYPRMQLVDSFYRPYDKSERDAIFGLFHPQVTADYVAEMNVKMGQWFGEAVRALLAKSGVDASEVAVVGSHGQTVCHHPDRHFTLQIGDPTVIAAVGGCPVVSDFRRQDMAVGGQGAPLVPYFDYVCFRSTDVSRLLLNIGGIANITVLNRGAQPDEVVAFDTGPGNMVLDGAMALLTGNEQRFDENGTMAKSGTVHPELVSKWSEDGYLHKAPPKSTGREVYGTTYVEARLREMESLSSEDKMATLTAFVSSTIATAITEHVVGPFELIIGGGGRHNAALVDGIVAGCRPALLKEPDAFGIPVDMKEAMAFALFAWQFLHDRPCNVPSATGATRPVILGQYTPSIR